MISGIEPTTFRLVAQWLNQLRHQQRAPHYSISLQVAALLGLLNPEDAVTTNCRNVGTNLPVDTASKTTLLFSSVPQKTSLWLLWLYITWFSLCNRVVTICTTWFNTKCFMSLSVLVFVCSVRIMLTINRHDTVIEHWHIYFCNEDGVLSVRQDLHSPTTTQAQFAVCRTVPDLMACTETPTVTWSTVRRHWQFANKQNLPNLHCVVSVWLSTRVFVSEFQPRCSW